MADKLPTDTELLDSLEARLKEGTCWVCRPSLTGRGWRLHETTTTEAQAFGWDAYPTAREAIAAAMGVKIEPSAGR